MTTTTEWAVREATRAIRAERAQQTAARLEVVYQEACAWSARVDAMQEEARRVADALRMDLAGPNAQAWERADDLANLLVREADAAWEARYDAQLDRQRALCWAEGVA